MSRGTAFGSLVTLEVAVAVALTLLIGSPRKPPSYALDSMVIFHGYRALVVFVAMYAVTVLLVRSFSGAMPTKVGTTGLEWPSGEAGDVAAEQMTKLNLRLDDQASFIENVMLELTAELRHRRDMENQLRGVDRELQQLKLRTRQLEEKLP